MSSLRSTQYRVTPEQKITSDNTPPDEDLVTRIANALRMGATVRIAALAAGCKPRTVRGWIDKGYEGHWAFVKAYQALTVAMNDCLLARLDKVIGSGDWRAHWQLLTALAPHEYGGKPHDVLPGDGVDKHLLLEDRRRKLQDAIERLETQVATSPTPEKLTAALEALRSAMDKVEAELVDSKVNE